MNIANRMQRLALALVVLSSPAALAARELAALDQNQDGRLSRAEHLAAQQAEFRRIDSDGDGVLSAPEMGTWLRSLGASPSIGTAALGAQQIAALDGNHDGRLSAAEHTTASVSRFVALDGDRDGIVTQLEWRTGEARIEPDTRVALDGEED